MKHLRMGCNTLGETGYPGSRCELLFGHERCQDTAKSARADLTEKGVEFKVAEATGLVRDKLRKGGLEELFGELGPSVDVNYVRRN